MSKDTLGAERAAWLCEWLEKKHGFGWQTLIAKKTGADQTMLSKIRKGERQAGPRTIQRLIKGLPISHDFFYAPKLGKRPDPERFMPGAERVDQAEETRSVVRAFIASPAGRHVTQEIGDELIAMDWGGVPVTLETVKAVWSELDAAARDRAAPDRAENQAPADVGNKRRIG